MGEVLGVGVTHFPPLLGPVDNYAMVLRRYLKSPKVQANMKESSSWPAPMQDEWEHEIERATVHQEQMIAAFKKVREAIDDFNPDAVLIIGNDQYENWHEDIIPAFHVFIADDLSTRLFPRNQPNVWNEDPATTRVEYKGHKDLAWHLTTELLERDFPISYSYKQHHFEEFGMVHAYTNGLMYLDWDRKGWPYPLVPLGVNGYGWAALERSPLPEQKFPPGPSPRSCFRFGEVIREILDERPERTVILASSGWSHAFLVEKNFLLWPDLESGRQHVEDMKTGAHRNWGDLTNADIDDAGDAEFKNWIPLAGAMKDRKAEIVDYLETYIFNSPKCFALFHP